MNWKEPDISCAIRDAIKVGGSQIPSMSSMNSPARYVPAGYGFTRYGKPGYGKTGYGKARRIKYREIKYRKINYLWIKYRFIPFRETAAERPPERKGRDAMSVTEIENYRELILENIEYDCLKQRYPLYLDDLNEIVELLVETVCAKRKTTRISGADFPHEIVLPVFETGQLPHRVCHGLSAKEYHPGTAT